MPAAGAGATRPRRSVSCTFGTPEERTGDLHRRSGKGGDPDASASGALNGVLPVRSGRAFRVGAAFWGTKRVDCSNTGLMGNEMFFEQRSQTVAIGRRKEFISMIGGI